MPVKNGCFIRRSASRIGTGGEHAVNQIIITLEPVIRTDNCGRQLFLCTGAARQDEDGRTRFFRLSFLYSLMLFCESANPEVDRNRFRADRSSRPATFVSRKAPSELRGRECRWRKKPSCGATMLPRLRGLSLLRYPPMPRQGMPMGKSQHRYYAALRTRRRSRK